MSSNDIGWNHIILEGFCCRTYSCKKGKYIYKFDVNGNIDSLSLQKNKVLNPCYDPKYKTPRKPKYCKNHICQDCYFKNCPHLGIGEVEEKDYKKIMKKINEVYK
jgi:hypothetical protein